MENNAIYGRTNTKVHQEITAANVLRLNPLASNYENMFAQLRPLIDEMKMVIPYGVGEDGGRKATSRTPELAQLMFPNEQMGWAEFADAMFATWLTESELDIRVHRTGRRKIIGYTILPIGCKYRDGNGEIYFEFMDGTKTVRLSADDVMMLRFSRNPRNIDQGVSPTSSVEIWAQIDDLAAQYQRAFFENGAVPATITFITASTREKYNEKRQALERGLKGAENKNKTIYAWRQLLDDGNSGDEVEVKTIQPPNSTLAIKDLNQIIVDRLNKAVGVSNFILGDDSSAKYDNAELSDHQFTKRRVYPALVSFWSQFQHELDRILGGLGYAIDFDLEIPELTERQKVVAETAKIEEETKRVKAETDSASATTLVSLINSGAEPEAAVKALGLDKKWSDLAKTLVATEPETQTETQTNALVLNDYRPQWGTSQEEQKARRIYELMVYVAEQYVAANPQFNLDEVKRQIAEELHEMAESGALDGASGLNALEFDNTDARNAVRSILAAGKYDLGEAFLKNLDDRVNQLVDSYDRESAVAVRDAIVQAQTENLSASELRKALMAALPRSRAEVIARNEIHHSINAGRLVLDQNIAGTYGLNVYQRWHANPGACEVCAAYNGETVKIGEAFPDHVFDEDDRQLSITPDVYNDYGKTPSAHVNCRCTYDEVLR